MVKLQIPKASRSLQPQASSTFLSNLPVPINATFCNNSVVSRCCLKNFRNHAKCTYYHRHNISLGISQSCNFSLEILILFNLFLLFFSYTGIPRQSESTGFLPYLGKEYLGFYFAFHNLSVLRNPTGALSCHFTLLFLVHVHTIYL